MDSFEVMKRFLDVFILSVENLSYIGFISALYTLLTVLDLEHTEFQIWKQYFFLF